jgi:hemerythrin-like domain-containing protein
MSYSRPMQVLVDEHEVIVSVLEAVETAAGQDSSGAFPADFFTKAIDFIVNYADHFHHAKEEDQLFPKLIARGIPAQGGPIGMMLYEHDEGRAYVQTMKKALPQAAQGDRAAAAQVREAAVAFAALLQDHIMKENQVLYRMGDQVMSAADKDELVQQFADAERKSAPADAGEKYRALAQELRRAVGLQAD